MPQRRSRTPGSTCSSTTAICARARSSPMPTSSDCPGGLQSAGRPWRTARSTCAIAAAATSSEWAFPNWGVVEMAKRRRFSSEPFGDAIERLMNELGVTYRGLAAKTDLSAGYLNHLVHGNRPVPSNDVIERLAGALDVDPEHFREYRLRVITDKLERMPDMVDRLYKRFA